MNKPFPINKVGCRFMELFRVIREIFSRLMRWLSFEALRTSSSH
jgi:hypothetical protein